MAKMTVFREGFVPFRQGDSAIAPMARRTDFGASSTHIHMTAATDAIESKKTGVFDDFVDIITSPAKVFQRRQDGKFGMHLLILTLLCVVLFFVFKNAMEPIFDAEFSRNAAKMMEKNPKMTAEQLEMGRKMGGTFAGIGFAIIFPISVMLVGVALWAIGKAFGAVQSMKQSMFIATISQVPSVIGMLLGAAQAMLLPADKLTSQYSITFSAARFMDPDATNAGVLGLIGRIDLIGIWIIILMGIGLSVIGKIDRPKAWAAAAIAWVLAILPFLIPALLA